MGVSVIIPSYNAVTFIDECLISINSTIPHEILIGVDGCRDTYNFVIPYESDVVKIFYFPENKGPFVIKNTLSEIAKYDNLLFFDSDDIMNDGTISQFFDIIQKSDFVKLNYVNFNKDRKNIRQGHIFNDAVIGIKKDVFEKLNGFYPWKCGADTEFTKRLEHLGYKSGVLEGISYYRRLHGENLTMRDKTKHGSVIRNKYVDIIQRNEKLKYWPSPDIKIKGNYIV